MKELASALNGAFKAEAARKAAASDIYYMEEWIARAKAEVEKYRFWRETACTLSLADIKKKQKTKNQSYYCVCLRNNSYPMPLTRVRKLMDELVSSCRIFKRKKKKV